MGSPIVPSDSGSPIAFTPVLSNVVMLVEWACCAGSSSRKVSAATTDRPLLVTLNLKILNEELVFIGIAVLRGGYRKLATLSPSLFRVQFNPRHEPTIPDVHNVTTPGGPARVRGNESRASERMIQLPKALRSETKDAEGKQQPPSSD